MTDAVCGDLINMSIREILRDNDLTFGEGRTSVATTANNVQVALSGITPLFSRPFKLWYVHPTTGSIVTLNEIDFGTYQDKYGTSFAGGGTASVASPGLPVDFSIFGATLYCGPMPDRVVTINVEYYKIETDWVIPGDDSATRDITTQGWEAVLFLALTKASKYGIEDDRAGIWADEYRNALSQLQREHQRRHTGARRPSSTEPG